MTNYTPSTGFMRDIYANYVAKYSNDSQEESFEEFDRWLAEHDAEVREQTLDALRPEYSDLIPTIQARLNQ